MDAFLIERKKYLEQLIPKRENRFIKIITGVRRCGKSFMLFTLYRQYLKSDGVADEQIVSIIYNELRSRGYAVDVGVVESQERVGEKRQRITRENDFVTNAEIPGERYYIQSALSTEEPEKMEQEIRPFLKLQNDFTKRIVITKSDMEPWTDQYGIHHLGVYDFLLSKDLPFHRHSLTFT